MKYKIEYSQIVRQKMKELKENLTEQFGAKTAFKGIKTITESVRQLSDFSLKGISVSEMFGVDTDFRYLYVKKNYLFYYIEGNKIIIAEMFDEREDFMFKLFGIRSESEESADYWDEWLKVKRFTDYKYYNDET